MKKYPNQVITTSQLTKALKGSYTTAYVIRIPSQERSEITRMMQSGEITTVDQVKEILKPYVREKHPNQVLTATYLQQELSSQYRAAYEKNRKRLEITKKMQSGEITTVDQVKEILKPYITAKLKRHPNQVLKVTQLYKELKGPYKTAYDKRIPKKLKSEITKKMQSGEITTVDQVKEVLTPYLKQSKSRKRRQITIDTSYEPPKQKKRVDIGGEIYAKPVYRDHLSPISEGGSDLALPYIDSFYPNKQDLFGDNVAHVDEFVDMSSQDSKTEEMVDDTGMALENKRGNLEKHGFFSFNFTSQHYDNSRICDDFIFSTN